MKTTTDFEKMTDGQLGDMIGDRLGMPPEGRTTKYYKPYAISLDACREAIEKFLSGGQYLRELYIEFSKVRVEAEAHATLYNWEGGFISHSAEHKNPARAASIAILKSLDKECK